MPLGYNRVLGDSSKPEAARPHRVALANWPASVKERRTETIEALIGHAASAGYEGLEMSHASFQRYYPGDAPAVVVSKARRAVEKGGLRIFGATLHVSDDTLRRLDGLEDVRTQMKLVQDLGGEFYGCQFFIHPDYAGTGGAYREDERYLRWCAQQVAELRDMAWKIGLNFYLEVHVDRITEDPAALCRILEMTTVELNGDMSHYLARGFVRGKYLDRILTLLGHTHVRMARKYGDLSAWVEDPKADWTAKGMTWQMFKFMEPALQKGFSSRTISGETGPMHLVKDTLTLDAKLVPLYRAMARFADAGAQGILMKVEEPGDLRPWG